MSIAASRPRIIKEITCMGFVLSKLFWVFMSPGNCLTLLLVIAAFMGLSHREACRNVGRRACFGIALTFFLIGILPVGEWALLPLENLYPAETPREVAGIILLGGDEKAVDGVSKDRPIYLDSGRRYIEFASLVRRYPDAALVYAGGNPELTPHTTMRDGDIAKHALAELGVPVEKMLSENTSRNTHENAVMSYKLVHPEKSQTWLLVTSAYHMPRALLTFQKVGWNVLPAPAGYLTTGQFSGHLQFNLGEHLLEMGWAFHEYYGLLAYRLMGYTDHLWPN